MVKHIEKCFGGIKIGDWDKIIVYMRLKLQFGVNFNVCVLSKCHGRYGS